MFKLTKRANCYRKASLLKSDCKYKESDTTIYITLDPKNTDKEIQFHIKHLISALYSHGEIFLHKLREI